MSYRIDARLNGRHPRLEVQDANSGSVRLAWEYRPPANDDPERGLRAEAAIDELFHQLFLLTTADYLRGRSE